MYSFEGGADGGGPSSDLLNVGGILYGTADDNQATLFSMTLEGKKKTLHSFHGSRDGEYPYGKLLDIDGTLYGTTANGGARDAGTIFSLTP